MKAFILVIVASGFILGFVALSCVFSAGQAIEKQIACQLVNNCPDKTWANKWTEQLP